MAAIGSPTLCKTRVGAYIPARITETPIHPSRSTGTNTLAPELRMCGRHGEYIHRQAKGRRRKHCPDGGRPGVARRSVTVHNAKMWGGFCLCLTLSSLLLGEENPGQDLHKSCRDFVGTFYAWYLAKAARETPVPAWDLALRYRSRMFSSALSLQLKQDLEAQRKAGNSLVGLDFDPFL